VLQSASAVGLLEKSALENRVRQLQIAAVNSTPVPAPNQAENEARIRALTQERNDLLAKLGEANQELYGHRKQDAAARINMLTDEVNALRARLAMDEAPVIPYTPEELALFKQPAPQLASRNAEKKSIKELPGGAAQLVAEAQHYFSSGQYDKAEDDYQKILQHDENNGLVLANLATIEMEQGRLDDAEKHIKAAVAQSPDDPTTWQRWAALNFSAKNTTTPSTRWAGRRSWIREILKFKIISALRSVTRACARRQKRRCARRFNSIPITGRRTTIWR